MKITFKPVSPLGKWTVGLAAFGVVVSPALYILAERLRLIPELVVTLLGGTAVVAAIAAFFTGIIAIIKQRERSVLVYLATLIGLGVIIFILVTLISDLVLQGPG